MLTDPAPGGDETSRDHWWVRPGWGPSTRWWTFHTTFVGQPGTPALLGEAARLRPWTERSGWDLVPQEWLHLTMQGVGDAALLSPDQVVALEQTARRAVAGTRPLALELGPATVDAEGINLPAHGDSAHVLDSVRDEIRASIGEVLGTDAIEGGPVWRPHVTLAYANTTGVGLGPVRAELAATAGSVVIGLDHVSLICLRREGHLYRWDQTRTLPLV